MKKYKRGYTAGVYDMFHIGHLNILKRAKEQCEELVVAVTTDELCFSRKNKYPIINLEDRMAIVDAIKYSDKVVKQENMDKVAAVLKYNCDAIFVGSDWKGTDSWNKLEAELKKYNIDVVYLDHTDGISSTILREKLNEEENKGKIYEFKAK